MPLPPSSRTDASQSPTSQSSTTQTNTTKMSTTRRRTTRRRFLKVGAGVAAATIVPRHVLGGPNHVAPSDRVNVALVGAGGRGLGNARELMKLADVRIAAVADPAERWDLSPFYYGGVAGRLPVCDEIETHYRSSDPKFKCQALEDYRELLERARPISTRCSAQRPITCTRWSPSTRCVRASTSTAKSL